MTEETTIKTERPALLSQVPKRRYPIHLRSGGFFMQLESACRFKKYFFWTTTRDGEKYWEVLSSREMHPPAVVARIIRSGGYKPCAEKEYKEIRSAYLEFHGIR